MSWGTVMHVAMAAYLFVIFLWVQHAMICLTRLRREVEQLRWTVEQNRGEGSRGVFIPPDAPDAE